MFSFESKDYRYRLMLDGEPVTKWRDSRYAALREYKKGKGNKYNG